MQEDGRIVYSNQPYGDGLAGDESGPPSKPVVPLPLALPIPPVGVGWGVGGMGMPRRGSCAGKLTTRSKSC